MLLIARDSFKEPVVIGTGYISGASADAVRESTFKVEKENGESVSYYTLNFILTARVVRLDYEVVGKKNPHVNNLSREKPAAEAKARSAPENAAGSSDDMVIPPFEERFKPRKNKEETGRLVYQRLNCNMLLKRSTQMMYKLLKDAKRGERVDIKGIIKNKSFVNKSGVRIEYEVAELESVIFPNKIAAALLGISADQSVMGQLRKEADDDALMDEIAAAGDADAIAAIEEYDF